MMAPPQLRWKFETHAWVHASPILFDGSVYIGNVKGEFFRIQLHDGQLQWEHVFPGRPPCLSGAIFGDAVIVATHDGGLHSLDRKSGEVVWTKALGSLVTANPIVIDEDIIVGSHDGVLHCMDCRSGVEKWRAAAEAKITSTAAVSSGAVAWGSDDYGLYCSSLKDGKQLWRHQTSFWVRAEPCIVDDVLFAADWTKIIAVTLEGTRKWEWNAGCEIRGAITCSGDDVLAGLFDGRIVSLDRKTGTLKWSVKTGEETGDQVVASPLASHGIVVCGSYDCHLYGIDQAPGAVHWRIPFPNSISTSAAHVGRLLVVGCVDGSVYCFDCDSVGALNWPTFRGSPTGAI